jgi:hypothetical protein
MTSRLLACVLVLALPVAACGPSTPSFGGDGGGGGPVFDGSSNPPTPDGTPGNAYDDADITAGDGGCNVNECESPVDDMCVGSEGCGADGTGDGLDNNCNGQVDETCTCVPGDVRACFRGPPGRRGVGSCEDGTMLCEGSGSEFGSWGACAGGIFPTGETCDTQDNNCNGCADDHPDCCSVEIACPGPGDLPEAAPFTDYVIDGTMFYGGAAQSWSWTVVGGPCDQLLFATAGTVSYTLTGANTSTVTFHPTLSGDYTFTLTVVAADGTVYTCTFIVHVRGPGLRVETCWDTTGSVDIDLHLHRDDGMTPWFTTDGTSTSSDYNNDDCYYLNCKGSSFYGPVNWGYPNSALAECVGGPEGTTWQGIGSCYNPRLDVDNIFTAGIPENINVDNPNDGDGFRVGVHYYGGSQVTHPLVNIYCGGVLTSTYGAAPNQVQGFNSGGGFAGGTLWRVADVSVQVSAMGVTTGCTVTGLTDPGNPAAYWVTNGSFTY